MKNLNIPNLNDIDCFEKIIDSKRDGDIKEKLRNLKHKIDNYYKEYDQKGRTRELNKLIQHYDGDLARNEKKEKDCLLHCYNNETYALSEIKVKIRKIQDKKLLDICQYCGINSPKTFDHFAPKAKFPEYCVLPKNLILCCWECNKNKKEVWLDCGNQAIINLYYDTLPEEIYLFAEIIFEDDVPIAVYKIENNNGINDEYFWIIKSHFKQLDLLVRYTERAATEIGTIRDVIKLLIDKNYNIEQIKKFLNEQAYVERNNKGNNYWKAALYNAISNSDEFLNTI